MYQIYWGKQNRQKSKINRDKVSSGRLEILILNAIELKNFEQQGCDNGIPFSVTC